MIYSFKISRDFFICLQKNLSYQEGVSILNFFQDLFLNRENLLYFDNRKIISDTNLTVGPNSIIVKELQQLLSNNIRPAEKLNNTDVDILFSNQTQVDTKKMFISTDKILNQKPQISKKIKDITPNKWLPNKKLQPNQLKKDLASCLKRVFRFSNKIYFVDAYLPDHLVNAHANVQSYKNSFKFFSELATNVKTVEFYNGVKLAQLSKKNVNKVELEKKLKKFYIDFKNYKSPVFIKSDENKAFKTMYERMFVAFLEDINLGIFTVERGLNIISIDNHSTEGRKITKQDSEWAEDKLKEWAEYVDKSDNYIYFNTTELK